MDQPGKVANPARGQLNRENNIPLSPCVPENLVSRDGFSRPKHLVLVKNLGELRWFGDCRYSQDRERGTLTISRKTFADGLVRKS